MDKNLGRVAPVPVGEFQSGAIYNEYDLVSFEGGSYLSMTENNLQPLSNEEAWFKSTERGEKGLQGDPLTFEDLTLEQLEELKGEVLDYTIMTEDQKQELADLVPTIGKVEEGDTKAVSGGKVYDDTYKLKLQQGGFLTINGWRLVNNGSVASTTNENVISDFVDITNFNKIVIKGRSSPLIPLINYYDINKTFISSVIGNEYNNIEISILNNEVPSGSYYARFNGVNNIDSYVIIDNYTDFYVKLNETNKIAETNKNNLEAGFDLSNTLNRRAYWRRDPTTLVRSLAGSPSHRVSDDFAIQLGDVISYGGTIVSTLTSQSFNAFLDKNKMVVAPIINSVGQQNIVITQEHIDLGYEYVSFSFREADPNKTLTVNRVFNYENFYKTEVEKNNLGNIQAVTAMGASLMSSENGWFERGVEILKCKGFNKAVSGTHPVDNCEKLWRKTFLADDEFELTDILLVQFANHSTIGSTDNLLPTVEDYDSGFDINNPANPFSIYTSAQQLDYILKYWQKWCYDQRLNINSKWFDSTMGKPFRVVFVTNWHDGRSTYNTGIRSVSDRWGGYVLEFDKKIGFSKSQPLQDGTQVSTLYARDNTSADGLTVGWHPYRIRENLAGKEIQTKMGNLMASLLTSDLAMI